MKKRKLIKLLKDLSKHHAQACQKIKHLFNMKNQVIFFSEERLKLYIYYLFFFPLRILKNFPNFKQNFEVQIENFDHNFYENIKKLTVVFQEKLRDIQKTKIVFHKINYQRMLSSLKSLQLYKTQQKIKFLKEKQFKSISNLKTVQIPQKNY